MNTHTYYCNKCGFTWDGNKYQVKIVKEEHEKKPCPLAYAIDLTTGEARLRMVRAQLTERFGNVWTNNLTHSSGD